MDAVWRWKGSFAYLARFSQVFGFYVNSEFWNKRSSIIFGPYQSNYFEETNVTKITSLNGTS